MLRIETHSTHARTVAKFRVQHDERGKRPVCVLWGIRPTRSGNATLVVGCPWIDFASNFGLFQVPMGSPAAITVAQSHVLAP